MTFRSNQRKQVQSAQNVLKRKPLAVETLAKTETEKVPKALNGFIDGISDNILVETSFVLRRLKPKHIKEGDFDTLFYNHLTEMHKEQLKNSSPHISYSNFVIAGYQVAIANRELLGTPFIEGLTELLPRRANLVSEHFSSYVARLCKVIDLARESKQ